MAGRGGWTRRRAATFALVACAAAGAPAPGAAAPGRVRPADDRSRALVEAAVAASPTVAALVSTLAGTDVVVVLQVRVGVGYAGDLRFATRAAGARYLVLRVDACQTPEDQIAMLGHELQHAREVAGAPAVGDEESLAALMASIGRATGKRTYETDAAVRVGRQVRQEVRRR